MRPLRHKPIYNNLFLTYEDIDGNEQKFYCDEISTNKKINVLIGMPVKDSGARYITASDIDFAIDGVIIQGEVEHRITAQPEKKPLKDNNSRRGTYRTVKIIETT